MAISQQPDSPQGQLLHGHYKTKLNEVITKINEMSQTTDKFYFSSELDKLIALTEIQVQLNSLGFGDAWTLSSGGQDMSIRNHFDKIDYNPLVVGVKHHRDLDNWGVGGIEHPYMKNFTDCIVLPTAGDIINTAEFSESQNITMVPYQGTTTLTSNLTTVGVKFRLGEDLPSGLVLHYKLKFQENGTDVKIFLQEYTLTEDKFAGDYIDDFYWSHSASARAGAVVYAEIRCSHPEDGPLVQVYPNITEDRHWNSIYTRTWQKDEIVTEKVMRDTMTKSVFVNESLTVASPDGSLVNPYTSLQTAMDTVDSGTVLQIVNVNPLTVPLVIPPNKDLAFEGNDVEVGYASYLNTNPNVMEQLNSGSTGTLVFKGIYFLRGLYGLRIKSSAKVELRNNTFKNCGWSGSGLDTIADYGKTQAELVSFWSGSETSNGGALRIENTPQITATENSATHCLRGFRFQDCGIGGYGYVLRNIGINLVESAIYLASSTYNATAGCENFIVDNNDAKYCANNGILVIGGYNNKIGVNNVEFNWNAGINCTSVTNMVVDNPAPINTNNRSPYNGIGNFGDALASVEVRGSTFRSGGTFIASISNAKVLNSGAGNAGSSKGIRLSDSLDSIDDANAHIFLDNNLVQNQDYGLDLACNMDTIKVHASSTRIIDSNIKDVLKTGSGEFYQLKGNVQYSKLTGADISVSGGRVYVKDASGGDVLEAFAVNELKALVHGSDIRIVLKDTHKTQFDLVHPGVTLDGTALNSDVALAVDELNVVIQGVSTNTAPVVTSATTVQLNEGDTLDYTLIATGGVAVDWLSLTDFSRSDGDQRRVLGGSNLAVGTHSLAGVVRNSSGSTPFTINVVVSAPPFASTKCVQFDQGDYAEATASLLDSILGRSGNNSGSAWTLAMRVKPVSGASGRILFYYGSSDLANGGYIEVRITGQNKIRLRYGTDNNFIQLQTTSNLTAGDWQEVIISFDGGTTGSSSGSLNSYYSRFSISLDGVTETLTKTHNNNGYTGNIAGQKLRIGKLISGNTMAGDRVSHYALWNTDQSANREDIHNNGVPFDLMTLTNKPEHWWRLGNGDTHPYLQDSGDTGGVVFQMYNMTADNFKTDS